MSQDLRLVLAERSGVKKRNRFFCVGAFEIGLGWDHFFGGVPAQSSRREASNKPIFDRLDIFSDAIDPKNMLAAFVLLHLRK